MSTSGSGYTCSLCGQWVPIGTWHECSTTGVYPPTNFCVCCPQWQKLNELLTRLEELLKKMEAKTP